MCDASLLISTNALQVTSQTKRRKALLMFINLVRWVRTVHDEQLLPVHRHQLFTKLARPTPYPGECESAYNGAYGGAAAPHTMCPFTVSSLVPSCYVMGSSETLM